VTNRAPAATVRATQNVYSASPTTQWIQTTFASLPAPPIASNGIILAIQPINARCATIHAPRATVRATRTARLAIKTTLYTRTEPASRWTLTLASRATTWRWRVVFARRAIRPVALVMVRATQAA
jgi:hypothetical protein